MMLPLFLFSLLSVAGGAPSTGTPESVFKRYDLVAAGGQYSVYEGENYLFPGCFADEEIQGVSDDRYFNPDDIEEALRKYLEQELEYEGRHYSVDERGQLSLLAPESVHRRVSKILSAFAQTSAVQAQLQVDILTVPPGSNSLPTGSIALADAEKGLQLFAEQVTESYTLPLRVSLKSILAATTSQDLLANFDLEIAQESVAFDPVLTTLLSGTRLQIEASPSRGGCNLAMLYWNGTFVQEVEEHPLDLRARVHTERGFVPSIGPDFIQSAAIAQRTLALNTLIPQGRGLVLRLGMSLDESHSEQRVLIRMNGDMYPPIRSTDLGNGQKLHMIRRDTFAPAQLELSGSALAMGGVTALLRNNIQAYSELLLADFREDRTDFETNLLQESLEGGEWEETHHWLLSFETKARGEANERTLHRLVDTMQPKGELIQVALQLEGATGKGERALDFDLPLRVGTPSAIVLGVGSTLIRDFSVEVAHGASSSDPVGSFELDGAMLLLHPTRSADGTLQLRVRIGAQVRRDKRMLSSADATFDRLQQSGFDRLALDQVIQFGPGQPKERILGNRAPDGGNGALRLRVSIR